jgi:hypothetical protein
MPLVVDTDTFLCAERTPLLSNPTCYKAKENRIPLDVYGDNLYTLHLHNAKTLSRHTALHILAKRKPANISSQKSTSFHDIKKLRVRENPLHIQNKQERGYGTLKRRD